MKNYCAYCVSRNLGLHEEPCRTCWIFDGHESHYTKYERDEALEKESECNGDYCEIEFEEE